MRIPLLRPRVCRALGAAVLSLFGLARAAHAWVPLGPDGGTVRVIAVDPGNPSTLYAAVFAGPNLGDGRGIYKSSNSGATWTAANVGLGSSTQPVTQIVINPQNPQNVFAATYFGPVFRSTNGGASWSNTSGAPGDQYSALVIDPLDPTKLYLATQHGVYRSTNGGNLYSASNSGLTSLNVSALAIDPSNPQVLYAGTFDGVFKSTDGASTWTLSNTGLPSAFGVDFLAVDPTSSSKVYAGGCGLGVYRSIDGGGSWSPSSTGLPSATGCVVALSPHPGVPGTLYAALTDDASHTVFVSTDSAATWGPVGTGLEGHVVESFGFTSIFPSIIYAGTQGGLFRSPDSGASWALRMTGIRHPYLLSVAVDPHTPSTLYASGGGDGPAAVVKSVDGGVSWAQTGPLARTPTFPGAMPEVSFVQIVVDPSDSTKVYLASDNGVFRSSDGGASWTWAAAQNAPYALWIAIDPLNPSVLYMATYGEGMQMSIDGGATWTVTNTGLPTLFSSSVVADPLHAGTVYASAQFRGVFKSVDGAASWTAINTGFPNPNFTAFGNLVIDPTNSDNLYVSAQGPYRTTDAGASWTRTASIGGGNPLILDPVHPATLYGVDELTVSKSADSGATWTPISALGMTEFIQGIAIDPTTGATLYAASLAGVFRSATATSICTSADDCNDGQLCTTDECDPGGPDADPGTGCRNAPVVCDAQCHSSPGSCDDGTGTCVYSSPAFPDGTSCDDGNLCTFDRCIGGVCAGNPIPDPACPSAGSTRFLMRQGGDPSHRKLLWRWNHGNAAANDFGNPLSVSRYTLCIYDRSGTTGDSALLMAADAPVGAQTCAGQPCWRITSGGFTYKDRAAASDGLSQVKLKSAAAGRSKILVKGNGAALPLPATPVVPKLTVQLRRADGVTKRCWGADYEGAEIQQNDTAGIKARTP